MTENQTKSIAVQWGVPSAILMMVLVVMMFNFSTKSKVNATDTVNRNMTTLAGQCADNFTDDLTLLEKVGKPIAELIGKSNDTQEIGELIEVAMKYSDAYMVYACDEKGNGISSNGGEVSVGNKGYFEAAKASDGVRYIYAANDGTQSQSSIVLSVPTNYSAQNEEGYLFLFYPLSKFEDTVKRQDFAAWNFEVLLDKEGNILAGGGASNNFPVGVNLYDALSDNNTDTIRKMKSRIDSRTDGMSTVEIGGTKHALIYIPMSMNNWTLVVGVNQSYIDKQIAQQWNTSKNMLFQLLIVIFAFICIIVVINIISKVKNNEKKRQLEEKADTDLLTGLNNKLATERKIKEFIAQNPNAQSMMFILDIDNFKKINDTMGHAFGDEVLRSLGQQIGAIFRATDIVGRAGGDEFIIFLKNLTEADAIRKEAKKVENFFKDFKAGEYVKYSATASIGVAIFPQEGADWETLYKAADQALYKAKKRGKNQLAFYRDEWAEEKQ
ncbi:MAG: sensor domain-containing diguanylate cyclase [Lachnospiraceae bacterium]|nr:sensor domain-containing diguanylate cyclase [Lachnospiraceae bacterium]